MWWLIGMEMWWFIGGDVVVPWWRCGGSWVEMWWLIGGDVGSSCVDMWVVHGWRCGASIKEMWWLNGRNVMVHWYSCRCSYPSPPPSSGVHVSSPHMNVHDKTCRFINTASFIRLRTWAVMNWRCGGSFVKKYIHIVSRVQVYILQKQK